MPPRSHFILSPANCSGQRAKLLFNERAEFHLAKRLRSEEGATLGEVFSFLSGLYFRGKLTYARAFARSTGEANAIWIITSNRGLLPPDTIVRLKDLYEFAEVAIDVNEPRYREPLQRDARALAAARKISQQIIFLGSVATSKYSQILYSAFGEQLKFPSDFLGRGDLSRGSLLLRAVDAGEELEYITVNQTR
jgi:hypothetical protein